ncbi:OsmC family protein [Planctomicrobium sp. SH661]|uniref:OsmC family protein n=1 Tax=Planctomicrobium sp. SH661 TaxID=3448124 RepID=UPI003F5BDA74
MNSAELRAMQAPFKDRYRQSPETALQDLTASGKIDFKTVTCELDHQGPPLSRTGLHPLTGGDGTAACAAEMLLEALVGCAGVTFAAVCTAMELPVEAAKLTATGSLDFRGTLGVSREVPVGFQSVRLEFFVKSTAPDEKIAKAVELGERYCVVAQTLKGVTASWQRVD